MKQFLFSLLFVLCLSAQDKKMNVLFIPIDDLKPVLSPYGYDFMKTPNIERLAERGIVFNNAHCQYAICGSSRISALTGLYIDNARVFSFAPKLRTILPHIVTLPQHFKNNGYNVTGIGKTFDKRTTDKHLDKVSWSIPYKEYIRCDNTYSNMKGGYRGEEIVEQTNSIYKKYSNDPNKIRNELKKAGLRPLTECEDYPDVAYSDGQKAIVGMQLLEKFSKDDKPFFLSIGFQKPHLPFVAPKKYWDLYDRDKIQLPSALRHDSIPSFAYGNMGELSSYSPKEEWPFSEEYKKEITHGYYACVSFIDAQIGLLLDKLDELGIADNTVVCLWGDHGFHLGDQKLWCKHSNFEEAVRSPLIIAAPQAKDKGKSNFSPVGLIDMYPTLCDLAGLAMPNHLEGKSLRPILNDAKASVKQVELAQYPRVINGKYAMGYTIRSQRYRYTAWKTMNYQKGERSGPLVGEELYDYQSNEADLINKVKSSEYKDTLALHRKLLEEKLQKIHSSQN